MKYWWVTFLSIALFSGTAWANDAVFGGCGGVMAGVDSRDSCVPQTNAHIELRRERLSFEQIGGEWSVVAEYHFYNHGDSQQLVVGFPGLAPSGADVDEDANPAPFSDYKVTVNRRSIRARVFDVYERGSAEAQRAGQQYSYSHVYLANIRFPAGQETKVTHRYRHTTSGSSMGTGDLSYILRTGGYWRGGRIGDIAISVRFSSPIANDCFTFSLPDATFDAATRTLHWEARDWRPTHDLRASWVDSASLAYQAVMEEEELVDLYDVSDEALRRLETPGLETSYRLILTAFRTPSVPAGVVWRADSPVCQDHARSGQTTFRPQTDPGLRRQDFPSEVATALEAIYGELKRRGARPALLPWPYNVPRAQPAPQPRQRRGVRAVYVARLSAQDHQNSRGRALRTAAGILRQDRANVHRFNRRDREDQTDPLFGDRAERSRFERLFRDQIPRDVAQIIRNGTPLVEVTVYSNRAEVRILQR